VDEPHKYFPLWTVVCRLLRPHVHFIQQADGGPIKIGCTRNVIVRLRKL
jgi:hypothetical protein